MKTKALSYLKEQRIADYILTTAPSSVFSAGQVGLVVFVGLAIFIEDAMSAVDTITEQIEIMIGIRAAEPISDEMLWGTPGEFPDADGTCNGEEKL